MVLSLVTAVGLLLPENAWTRPAPVVTPAPGAPISTQRIDAKIQAEKKKKDDFQAAFFAANGRYAQVLDSHSMPPKAAAVLGDKLGNAPTDQQQLSGAQFVAAAGIDPVTEYLWRMDVYDGPSGAGYVEVYRAEVNNTIQERAVVFGSETYRAYDWRVVVSAVITP